MRKVSIITKLTLFCLLFLAATFKVNAQSMHPNVPDFYVFTSDSLQGFDEESAKQAAFAANAYGDEYKVYMYFAKREYVKSKYNMVAPPVKSTYNANNAKIAVANCVNEDFEFQGTISPVPSTITITSSTGVNGWNVTSGTTGSGSTVNCSLSGSYLAAPNQCSVISTSSLTGAQDQIIGSGYKIYSVFGNNPNNGPSQVGNPSAMYGDWVIKINNHVGGSGVHKLTKTFAVTPANALFQFAFIAVIQGAHCCCDNAGFALKVYKQTGCSGVPTLTTCPSFTASPPAGAGCTPSGTCAAGGATTYYNAATSGWYYNKWKVSTMDLSSYIGDCITIEVYAFDCPYSGHAGYVYFDAQCNPMAIIGNGTSFPAGTPQITLPTCGTGNTATITAPPGMGPYLWNGPDPLIVGSTAQTVTTSITGNYTITMNPPGSCGPSVKQVSVIISPAPNLIVSTQTQVSCTSTLNGASFAFASGTPITTLTPNYIVSVLPTNPTGTISTAAGTANYTGFSVGVNTITITDANGCQATTTLNFNASVPIPSFTITPTTGTIVGCNPSVLTLNAINTGSLTNMTYTWVSTTTGTATGNTWTGGVPSGTVNVLTVTGMDATVGSCPVTVTFAISQSTAIPGVTVTPISRTITCNGAPATFTASSTVDPNVLGQWFVSPGVPQSGASGSPVLGSFNAPGTYTVTFVNLTNGCTNSQTVSVFSSTVVPTITITANLGYTITCAVPCVSLAITGSAGPAPISYSWTNVTTNATVTPANGGYSVCVPGSYIASYKDGNNCTVTQTVNVMIDTARIFPTAITNLPSNGFTLTCSNPTLNATAISSPMMAANSYSWITPPNLVVNNDQVIVGLSNVTSTTTPTNYTVMVKGPNGCVGRQKVSFYKNTFVPPYQAVFTPSAITCANSCVLFSPLATPASTIPVTYTFTSPAPTFTSANIPGATFCAPGTYTMTYQSTINGCTSTTTAIVPTNVAPPATVALTPKQIPCGQTTTIVTAGTATTSTTYSYTWVGPENSGMSAPNGYSTSVNMSGVYNVVITNTINGCTSTNSVLVTDGSIDVSMTPDPSSGYAPLPVTFNNTTPYTSSSGTITTFWSYGNGIVTTNTALASSYSSVTTYPYNSGSAIYQTAGSYTVLLMVTQTVGTVSCVGTATAVVNVELPSDLTVPNVFTPNGDGVNDNFTLLTTNIKEVKCAIFDRWGVKVYDVTSDKGNISWDGKNFGGKEMPAGTYFYILTAEGKDAKTEWTDSEGKTIKMNGTISLFR